MNKKAQVLTVVALLVAIVAVLAAKQLRSPAESPAPASQPADGVPRFLDLGSTTCIPCKMMAPIIEDIRKEYAGRLDVEFIDVNLDEGAKLTYGVSIIPTQIFFDGTGKEVFRHEGFMAREDILAKWNELGIDLGAPSPAPNLPSGE